MLKRWLPFAFTVALVTTILIRAGTPALDLLRYAGYAGAAVILPGTLVYRALRRTPHTLVEDLAMGAAVGLALEVPAWAVFAVVDRQQWLWAWPLAVVVPFGAVPRLRRHWVVRGYATVPLGWSWTVAGAVSFFTGYLAAVFLDRNPLLPTSEHTLQYLDLPYQLSLAGEAKHDFPVGLPQVAGEPLHYHWFGHVHMAATSLVGHIDLPVVALRLTIPALCAAAIVLTAVIGWRVSGRPFVGATAAILFFVVGEFNFTHPVTMPFGTQVTFVVWHGMSMIYSWVLLIALIGALAEIVDQAHPSTVPRLVPAIGRGAFAVAALLLFASGGAKVSSLPVVASAVAATAVVVLVTHRRIPWSLVVLVLVAGLAQLLATAVLFRFQRYGVHFGPLKGLRQYWAPSPDLPELAQWLVVAGVWVAFGLNLLLRTAGIIPLLWLSRGRLAPVQWFLLAGALAGPALYLVFSHPGTGNQYLQYFIRAGFTFGVILSAWGYWLVFERARLSQRARWALAGGTVGVAGVLLWAQVRYAGPGSVGGFGAVAPVLGWAGVLAALGVLAGLAWRLARRRRPSLRGRGPVLVLTAVLVAGFPGLIMDAYKSMQSPNGGAYTNVALPRSRVEAARWVRDHSDPDDVLATNVHCLGSPGQPCDSRSFWLSAYSERSVLVEGWGFAPRLATMGNTGLTPFWDPDKLRRNDAAFTAPTPEGLREMHDRFGVRWLVVDRSVGQESAVLRSLAVLRFDNGRMAVYHLR